MPLMYWPHWLQKPLPKRNPKSQVKKKPKSHKSKRNPKATSQKEIWDKEIWDHNQKINLLNEDQQSHHWWLQCKHHTQLGCWSAGRWTCGGPTSHQLWASPIAPHCSSWCSWPPAHFWSPKLMCHMWGWFKSRASQKLLPLGPNEIHIPSTNGVYLFKSFPTKNFEVQKQKRL